MKKITWIICIVLAAVVGTFIGTSLANRPSHLTMPLVAQVEDAKEITQTNKPLTQDTVTLTLKKQDKTDTQQDMAGDAYKQGVTEQAISQKQDIVLQDNEISQKQDIILQEAEVEQPQDERYIQRPLFSSVYTPQKDVFEFEEIPIEITRDIDAVIAFIMGHPVDQSTEKVIMDATSTVDVGLERQMKNNKELFPIAENSLSPEDYKLYTWNKMRLEALEFGVPWIQPSGGRWNLQLDVVHDDTFADPDIWGEPQVDTTILPGRPQEVYQGVELLLDKRFWVLKDYWKPLDEGETDVGYDTEIVIAGDVSLKKYTDAVIKSLFANYDADALLQRIDLWRQLDWSKIITGYRALWTVPMRDGERVGDLYFWYQIIPDTIVPQPIEIITITRYDEDWLYGDGKSVEEVLKEQGKWAQ
jgi:hypothetical protein